MINNDKAWCVEWYSHFGYGGFSFRFSKDTIINGDNYKVFVGDQNETDISYLFEDLQTKQVFRYDVNSKSTHLLYDFNLTLDDTITLNFKDFTSVLMSVTKVDTLISGGDTLKVINFNFSDSLFRNKQKLRNNFKWIEGVGSNWHPNYHDNYTTQTEQRSTGYEVICAYKGNDKFYISDTGYCKVYSEYSSCQRIINNKLFLQEDILIYPSPFVEDYFTIEAKNIKTATIYDTKGALIFEVKAPKPVNVLSVFFDRSLASGVYYVRVEADSHTYLKKVMK